MLQVLIGRSAITIAMDIQATIDPYEAGVREPGMEKIIFPNLTVADRVLATLRRINGRP